MNTAEVAIEHILAGLLALCAFVLPFFPWSSIVNNDLMQKEAIIVVLGFSYMFGIVFDKAADTVLSPIEQWSRLCKADEHLKKGKKCYGIDPFPQDTLEYVLRGDSDEGHLEWMHSLRSRIRTCRGLAVYGIPAAMGIAISQCTSIDYCSVYEIVPRLWYFSPVVMNLIFIFMSIYLSSSKKFKLYRTDELNIVDPDRKTQMGLAYKRMYFNMSCYRLIIILSCLTLFIISFLQSDHFKFAAIGFSGVVASMFALWAWYRITETYLSFIYRKLPDLIKKNVGK